LIVDVVAEGEGFGNVRVFWFSLLADGRDVAGPKKIGGRKFIEKSIG